MKWRKVEESKDSELSKKIRDIITMYYDLDEEGNPTIPTEEDLGIMPDEFAVEAIDRIWKLVK